MIASCDDNTTEVQYWLVVSPPVCLLEGVLPLKRLIEGGVQCICIYVCVLYPVCGPTTYIFIGIYCCRHDVAVKTGICA